MEDCELFFDDYKYQGIVYKCLDPQYSLLIHYNY